MLSETQAPTKVDYRRFIASFQAISERVAGQLMASPMLAGQACCIAAGSARRKRIHWWQQKSVSR